jgi:cytochrome b6-f complex iron-sulfur subunit
MVSARVTAPNNALKAEVNKPNRREFLYYLWGASMALALGATGAGLAWYMLPRTNEEIVSFDPDDLPLIGSTRLIKPEDLNQWSRLFSLAHTDDDSLIALYRLCTHEHCLIKWIDLNHRYECPCHGSKFKIDGTYIEGPAPRHLDRYHMTITFEDGTTATTNDNGDPIPLAGREIIRIEIDTRQLIAGAPRPRSRRLY